MLDDHIVHAHSSVVLPDWMLPNRRVFHGRLCSRRLCDGLVSDRRMCNWRVSDRRVRCAAGRCADAAADLGSGTAAGSVQTAVQWQWQRPDRAADRNATGAARRADAEHRKPTATAQRLRKDCLARVTRADSQYIPRGGEARPPTRRQWLARRPVTIVQRSKVRFASPGDPQNSVPPTRRDGVFFIDSGRDIHNAHYVPPPAREMRSATNALKINRGK